MTPVLTVLALAGGLGLLFALLGLLADYLLPAVFAALGRPDGRDGEARS